MAEGGERVLFVHAHPDDETLASGATIATLIRDGAAVLVLTCTRGELGEIIPPRLADLTPLELGDYRVGELDRALAALGVREHLFLGETGARWAGREPRRYLDSGMHWGRFGPEPLDPVDPQSLMAAEVGEVAADIAAVIIQWEPDVVVSYAADGGYGHPDHMRVHEATRTAAEVLRLPFYVIDGDGSRRGAVTVDPVPVLDAKRAALEAHATQVSLAGDSYSLSSGDPRPIAAVESFTRLRPADESFRSRSTASKVATAVLAVVIGLLAGATLTAAHQATVDVGTVSLPWGIVAAVLVTAALLVGLRIVFETRVVAACAAAGLLAASTLLSVQSGGGSILVPGNTVGYVWVFAPVVITLVVLVWPRRGRRAPSTARGNIGSPAAKGPHPQ